MVIDIQYDVPIEVSERHYNLLMTKLGGAVAGRVEDDKYYIKVWAMQYVDIIKDILTS